VRFFALPAFGTVMGTAIRQPLCFTQQPAAGEAPSIFAAAVGFRGMRLLINERMVGEVMEAVKKRNNLLLNGLIAVLVIALVAGIAYWFWSGYTKLPILNRAPEFTLQNLEGQPVSLTDYNGKVRLVEFIFTNCPDICPVTTAKMVNIQNELKEKGLFGEKVQFVSVTFDPERDTPEVLQKHADAMGIDQSGWVLLRGTEEETHKVVNDFGAFVEEQPDGTFVHATRSLYLVDGKNNIRRVYYMGDEMPTEEVLEDIVKLAKEL
jgi:protein SCO1/2